MTQQRFYVSQALSAGLHTLPNDVTHHMRVLRLRVGDTVELFNGSGVSWCGQIIALDKTAQVQLVDTRSTSCELPFKLNLAQSLIEPSKMDWVVEKAVELGVNTLYPISASRSVTRLDADRAMKRLQHWRNIAIAASEQSGRNIVMNIAQPLSLSAALNTYPGTHILLHPFEGVPLQQWCNERPALDVTLWVGPEGGWAPQEIMQFEQHGAQRLSFGPRILRTETAGVAIAAALQALWVTG